MTTSACSTPVAWKVGVTLFSLTVAPAFSRHVVAEVNPVPPPQAVAVMAVLEAAVESSAEGKAVALPLTSDEVAEVADPTGDRPR